MKHNKFSWLLDLHLADFISQNSTTFFLSSHRCKISGSVMVTNFKIQVVLAYVGTKTFRRTICNINGVNDVNVVTLSLSNYILSMLTEYVNN